MINYDGDSDGDDDDDDDDKTFNPFLSALPIVSPRCSCSPMGELPGKALQTSGAQEHFTTFAYRNSCPE